MLDITKTVGAVLCGYHYGMVYQGGVACELDNHFDYAIETKNFEAYRKIYIALKALGYDFDDWRLYASDDADDPFLEIKPNDWKQLKELFKLPKVSLCWDREHG